MENKESKNEYIRRINRVQDYIENNITCNLSLEELSDIAGFSKYHFHRIFKAITQQSLSHYVNRIRLERSTHLLSHRLDMSVTDIAYHLGFTDSAVFSRSFKNLFKVSPIEYRKNYRKNCKDQYNISRYNSDISNIQHNDVKQDIEGEVEIVTIEKFTVAYLRFTGTFKKLAINFPLMLEKLFKYTSDYGLSEKGNMMILSAYHDHPEFTEPDFLKTSLCVSVPSGTKIEDNSDISIMEISGGQYIVGHFYIHQHQYSDAWDYIYEEWLTKSGYVPRDDLPFEMYMNDYHEDPHHKHLVDIYLPVQPL